MRPFRDLEVWKLGHEIVLDVYRVTRSFPREELYGLISQMRRASYSIPMNIVEGSVKSDPQFYQALRTSLGSASELEYQLLLANDLDYLSNADYQSLLPKLQREVRMLVAFMKRLQPRQGAPEPRDHVGWQMADEPLEWSSDDEPREPGSIADSRWPMADEAAE